MSDDHTKHVAAHKEAVEDRVQGELRKIFKYMRENSFEETIKFLKENYYPENYLNEDDIEKIRIRYNIENSGLAKALREDE